MKETVVTFKEKERKLPKTWEEFCEMFPIKKGESYIHSGDYIETHIAFAQKERENRDLSIVKERFKEYKDDSGCYGYKQLGGVNNTERI